MVSGMKQCPAKFLDREHSPTLSPRSRVRIITLQEA